MGNISLADTMLERKFALSTCALPQRQAVWRMTCFVSSIYAIQHDPTYFPSPYAFNPDRWIRSDSPGETKSPAMAALNPFSIGPRRCAGRSMALLELRLLVARTLFGFDFRLADGQELRGKTMYEAKDEFRLYSHVTSYCEGPWLAFKAR
jgi:cytochrome P450